MILPFDHFRGNSDGENFVWKTFRELLPGDYVSFHNYYLGVRQADIILLVPRLGVLVIEIKGFYPQNILDVPDRTVIMIKNQPPEPSPFDQADRYRKILINDFLQPIGICSVFVICAVCYPYISKKEYAEKKLNKISHERLTITSEDLTSEQALIAKIHDIFSFIYDNIHMPVLVKYGFENSLIESVGNLICPDFRNSMTSEPAENRPAYIIKQRNMYSQFHYVRGQTGISEEQINQILSDWISGTKIYIYSDDEGIIGRICTALSNFMEVHELSFPIKNGNTFLFSAGFAPALDVDINIQNGLDYDKYKTEFATLHIGSNFNKDQYEIEHAPLCDIIVKAGAGTGKTYSIVSRVNYLIWKNGYSAHDLKNAIAMITFTNESADAMKERLSDNFLNYYKLTKDSTYLDMIESIEDMNISTIHSISKRILQEYASKIGLGKDFSIVSGDYKRRQILTKKLNEFITANPQVENELDLSMFILTERLMGFLNKLDNKNVEITTEFDELKFGKASNPIFDALISVLKDTQLEMNYYCKANNNISLGDLIRKLKMLRSQFGTNDVGKTKIDFLFVDEFQDTDDVQIELMQDFQLFFGFHFFVVGDIKQCIYRFRGAEVKAFDTLQRGRVPMHTISLNKNYRTDTKLLQKMNSVFSRWDINGALPYAGDDVLQGTKDLCENVEFFNVMIEDEQKFEEKLVTSINKLCMMLEDTSDKLAILVRYNWQIAQIKDICKQNHIKVETEIGGELFRIDPTIDLFKLLLALKYNKSPKHLYNLYTTSYVDDELPKLLLVNKNGLNVIEHFYTHLPGKLGKWNEYLAKMRTEPILAVIRDIIDDVKPWEVFSHKTGVADVDIDHCESYYIRNLDQLFEKLIAASNSNYLTPNKLTDYLEIMILTRQEEEARESYSIENTKSQVILTTVHKSKGLEFDTVLLPFCDFEIASARPKGEVDLIYSGKKVGYRIIGSNHKIAYENDLYKQFQKDELVDRQHEETRILYVALTRAIKRIVYFTNAYGKRKPEKCWYKMIREGDE